MGNTESRFFSVANLFLTCSGKFFLVEFLPKDLLVICGDSSCLLNSNKQVFATQIFSYQIGACIYLIYKSLSGYIIDKQRLMFITSLNTLSVSVIASFR